MTKKHCFGSKSGNQVFQYGFRETNVIWLDLTGRQIIYFLIKEITAVERVWNSRIYVTCFFVGCDPFLFNNIKETISKQWCKILSGRKGEQFELWCSRKKNKQYWIGLDIWNSNVYVGLYAEVNIHRILDDHGFYHIIYISGPKQACEELMDLETRLGKGFFWYCGSHLHLINWMWTLYVNSLFENHFFFLKFNL